VTLTGDLTGTYLVVAQGEDGTLTLQPVGAIAVQVIGDTAGLTPGALHTVHRDGDGRLLLERSTPGAKSG